MLRALKFIFKTALLIICLALIVAGINLFVIATTVTQIEEDPDKLLYDGIVDRIASEVGIDIGKDSEESGDSKEAAYQCIMVLGASVNPDGSPSDMLNARLDTGIKLYKLGVAPKLLFSGDNGQEEYDEVTAMKNYAMKKGVPEKAIVLDYAGFNTYDSIYRADYIFCVKRMVVVSQKDHLYRALYGCKRADIEAKGCAAEGAKSYAKDERTGLNYREIAARVVDVVKWIVRPEPTFLGDKYPICGTSRFLLS